VTSTKPRLCIVSEELDLPTDEGLKKFVYSIAGPLSQVAEVRILATATRGPLGPGAQKARANRFLFGSDLRRRLRAFDPDAVIYVPRAAGTRNSFIRARVLRAHVPRARTMLVSLQPRAYGPITRSLLPRAHPDVTVAQSNRVRDELRQLGLPSIALPSGVDLHTFRPIAPGLRTALRREYGLPENAFVVLHVGHFRRERNVMFLGRLKRELRCEVVMVGSTSTDAQSEVEAALRVMGVRVIDQYVERVQDLYAVADCYVFPVHVMHGAIEMPLSVLEAMACGVPVVSTHFGSLTEWLDEGPGLTYAATDRELLEIVRAQRDNPTRPDSEEIRDRVATFGWEAIAGRVMEALSLPLAATAGMDLSGADEPKMAARTANVL